MKKQRRYISAFNALILIFAIFFLSFKAQAACSQYTGFATINELFHKSQNNRPTEYFVEVKALDPNIVSSGAYTGWTINLCSQSAGGCTGTISLSQATVNNSVYLVLDENDVPAGFMDFNSGLEVLLLDDQGNAVDYLTVDSYSVLGAASCNNFVFDTTTTSSNTFNLRRKPDGTGNWDQQSGNSGDETSGDTNDGGTTGVPTLSMQDVLIYPGDTASITINLSATGQRRNDPITFQYFTVDATATVTGGDYTQTSGTFTITPSRWTTTSETVTIPTSVTASAGEYFQLFVAVSDASAGTAIITDHFANITFRPPAGPVAAWWFDELSWDGTGNEVIDASGNDLHGTGSGGANTSFADPPGSAIPGNPGTCRFGDFNGATTYVEVADNNLLDLPDELTISVWVNPRRYPSSGLMSILSKDENYEFHLKPNGVVNWWWNNSRGWTREFDSTATVPLNAWTHIAIVYSQSRQTIYINGQASGFRTYSNEVLRTNSDPLQIGDDQLFGGGSRRFDGFIDEVRIYDTAFNQSQVLNLMNEVHPCTGLLPAGFDISFGAGSASTCTPLPVTITAIDSNNNVLTGYTGTIEINTQTLHGDWSAGVPDSPLNAVNNGTADDGAASYQFDTTDSGSIDLLLSNIHADNLTVSVSDPFAGVTSISAPINFRDNAFVVTPVTCTGATCPSTEVVAGRDHVFNAALWRRDSSTGDCAIATAYDTSANPAFGDLKAWIARDVVDPSGITPIINGNTLADNAPVSNNLDLTFTGGQAQFTLNSSDVGKYSINLRDDTSGFARDDQGTADTSDDVPLTIEGSSDTLTVRPFALGFTNIRQGALLNPGGTATAGDKFVPAGDIFEATVGAYLWQSADDTNNDGVVDDPAVNDVTNNGLTPAYSFQTDLSSDTTGGYTPAAGLAGLLGGSTSPDTFTAGQQSVSDLTYSEVGSMRMLAEAIDFLGTAGVNVTGQTIEPVGRFYPAYYEVVAVNITPASSVGGFTYMGQPDLGIQFIVQAHRVGGGVTTNYFTGGYDVAPVNVVAENNNDGVDLSGRISGLPATSWVGGEYVVNAPAVQFSRLANPDGPYEDLALGVRVSDTFDDAELINQDMNPNDAGDCVATGNCDAVTLGATSVLYGRAVLRNAYGREDQDLPLVYDTEYFDGTAFVINSSSDVGNTSYDATSLSCADVYTADTLVCADITETGSNVSPGNSFTLSAPNKRGRLQYTLDVDDWLKYDWNGDGAQVVPQALVTFGLRGDDRFIHWRETR
jgi:MSHA biogenesis protein MshQ